MTGLDSYRDKERRRYIHLIDGGVSDNLGVRSAYERVHILGGARQASKLLLGRTPSIIAMVVVNAETHPDRPMDLSRKSPGTNAVLGALTDTQLQRGERHPDAKQPEAVVRRIIHSGSAGHALLYPARF